MRPTLRHIALPENDNHIAVVYRAQAMRDKYRCAFLFLDEGVDVVEEGLFGVGV